MPYRPSTLQNSALQPFKKMNVSAIVATAKNGAIGKDGQIPWYLPEDLKWFKKQTLGRTVIMGRATFESIGRPLPKRTNIVITRDAFFVAEGVLVAHSVEEALEMALDLGETEAFVIGGGQIYRQTMAFWDRIFWTEVEIDVDDADAFFPKINLDEWQLVSEEKHEKDEKNDWPFCFRIFEKK